MAVHQGHGSQRLYFHVCLLGGATGSLSVERHQGAAMGGGGGAGIVAIQVTPPSLVELTSLANKKPRQKTGL